VTRLRRRRQDEEVDHDVGQAPGRELLADDVLAVLAQEAVGHGGEVCGSSSSKSSACGR
jgi:hypothetical protein